MWLCQNIGPADCRENAHTRVVQVPTLSAGEWSGDDPSDELTETARRVPMSPMSDMTDQSDPWDDVHVTHAAMIAPRRSTQTWSSNLRQQCCVSFKHGNGLQGMQHFSPMNATRRCESGQMQKRHDNKNKTGINFLGVVTLPPRLAVASNDPNSNDIATQYDTLDELRPPPFQIGREGSEFFDRADADLEAVYDNEIFGHDAGTGCRRTMPHPTLLQSSTCRYTRMSSKNDVDGGRIDPFEDLSRTTHLETYRMNTKLGDAGLDRETTTGTASGWTDIWNPMLEQDRAESSMLDFDRQSRTDEKESAGQLDVARESMTDDLGVPQTFAHTIVTITEEHESCTQDRAMSELDSQETECWRETGADALEERDTPRSIDRCAYSHVPIEDFENEDDEFRMRSEMREEPTCLPQGLVTVTLV